MDLEQINAFVECTSTFIENINTDSSEDEEIALKAIYLCQNALAQNKTKKRTWVKSWRKERDTHSSFQFLTKTLRINDKESFFNYIRMDEQCFQFLLSLIEKDIKRQNTIMRKAIPPEEKLVATLRFLATGESYMSSNYQTRLSQPFLSQCIPEVCEAIWNNLKNTYLKFPDSKMEWERIAERFLIRWQFPNCLGALDGKHIVFRSLKKDGAFFHNYKGTNSIILLALVDADCKFLYVDIGCNGRMNDAGVLLQSSLKHVIDDAAEKFPADKIVGEGRMLPYVIVGDDAFPLQKHLLKPYPYHTRDTTKRLFNIRLSRARHVVEHAFGILSNRFKVFQTTMNIRVENVALVTQACCVLHNFLMKHNPNEMNPIPTVSTPSKSNEMTQQTDNPRKGAAEQIRHTFAEYFCNEGKVDWQQINI